jgi:hypothetical protein
VVMTTERTINRFETERFDLLKENRVCVADYRFGRNLLGSREVWIESSDKGERFLSQISFEGETYAVRKEIYTRKCYILREKTSSRYYFLDLNDCGFWLHSERFSGAATFFGDEAVRVQSWLAAQAN